MMGIFRKLQWGRLKNQFFNMVNKKFLEMAERMKRDNVPEPKSKLTHIVQRNDNGFPILYLNTPVEIRVHTPTREEYDALMQVFECGGWEWCSRGIPTEYDNWKDEKEKTHLTVEGETFSYGSNSAGLKAISTQDFYDMEEITPDMFKEINEYFETNFPNRESKGGTR